MKKRLVLLMALSLTFAFPAAVMAEDTTAAEETADDTEAADSTAEDADVKSEGVMTHDEYLAAAVDDEVTIETRQSSPGGKIKQPSIPRTKMVHTSFIICHAPKKTMRSWFREPRSK